MNNKLVCPFCGEKLYSSDNCYVCLNDDCIFCGFHFMEKRWKPIIELKQALIQAKQDLKTISAKYAQSQKSVEIARKASDNSREKLAAFMHDTWGNWFAYQLNNSTVENLQRWGVQSNTPYSSLSETDKDKDRKFADKIIEIIKEQIDHIADVSKMIEHKE